MKSRRAFTLVELLLAMTFLSVLMMSIALLTIQIISMYTRGVTLRSVNQSGQVIIADLKREINQASGDTATGYKYVPLKDASSIVYGGRLCTGSVSYAWNTVRYFNASSADRAHAETFANSYDDNTKDLRFTRLDDTGSTMCTPKPDGTYQKIPKSRTAELIPEGDRSIVVHSFEELQTDNANRGGASGQRLVTISFSLGTQTSDDYITDVGGNRCKAPGENHNEFCAINKFIFTARAGNVVSGS